MTDDEYDNMWNDPYMQKYLRRFFPHLGAVDYFPVKEGIKRLVMKTNPDADIAVLKKIIWQSASHHKLDSGAISELEKLKYKVPPGSLAHDALSQTIIDTELYLIDITAKVLKKGHR